MKLGHIDLLMQSHVQGWAAVDGQPGRPLVKVNKKTVGQITPNLTRRDLALHGIAIESGFHFGFPEPLGQDDVCSIEYDDGTQLGGSPSTKHQSRLKKLFSGIDLVSMVGMEVGPLDRPLLSKARAKVDYVDNATHEKLVAKTARGGNEFCDPQLIREVDVVWDRDLSLCTRKTYDFCLSSHVIEHIPNLIGWLQQIASVLREGACAT
jgi:hypothetical protein